MDKSKATGHIAIAGAYTIFGLNIVFCKDIANAEAISPMLLFTLRAFGASILFWILSFFLPREKVSRADFWKIAAFLAPSGRYSLCSSRISSRKNLSA